MGRVKIDQHGIEQLAAFFSACNYQIAESEAYGWRCYGPHSRIISAIKTGPPGRDMIHRTILAAAEIVVDSVTHTVFEISVAEFVSRGGKGSAYKWMNPLYKLEHDLEASRRTVPPYQAWDNVNYKLTPERAIMSRVRDIFLPKAKKRKPKKRAQPQKKYLQANKRKKVRSRR